MEFTTRKTKIGHLPGSEWEIEFIKGSGKLNLLREAKCKLKFYL